MRSPLNWFSVGVVCAVLCAGSVSVADELAAGPMLGDITSTQAQVWLKTDAGAEVRWVIALNEDFKDIVYSKQEQASVHGQLIMKASGLSPQTRYVYNLIIDGKKTFDAPLPSFITATSKGTPGRLRIAFTSCLGKRPDDSRERWADMASQDIDLVLLLGDQHYANTTDADILRDTYLAYRMDDSFRRIARQKPVYAIWDDHDYAGNDKDGTVSGKEDSLAVFKELWPNPDFGLSDDAGIYYSFERSGVEFFMLDVRYHRSPKDIPDSIQKSHLGKKQLAWLKEGLKASTARVKIIASGVEFNAGTGKDSWLFYSQERKEILDFIITHKIEGVIFISGDSHYTAGFQMKEGFIEITSGPLGSRPNVVSKNSFVFKALPQGRYYSILDIDTSQPSPVINWQARGSLVEAGSMASSCRIDWKAVLRKRPVRCE